MTKNQPSSGPSEDQAPKKKTDVKRSKGGDSSGMPPSFRIATGLEDWPIPFRAPEGHGRGRSQLCDVFGIDFGDETTRVAGLNACNPLLVPPKVIPTAVGLFSESLAWEAQQWRLAPGMLRTRLRSHKAAKYEGRTLEAPQLATEFFRQIYQILGRTMAAQAPKVVLTVPSFYCSAERKELVSVAEAAGFVVLGLINDYAAPALSFARRGPSRSGHLLVIAIGSASCSTAIMKAEQGCLTTKSVAFEANFGGGQLIQDVISFLMEKACCEPAAEQSDDLRVNTCQSSLAIETLHALANAQECENPFSGPDTITTINREELNAFIRSRLTCVEHLITTVLASAQTYLESIDYVLLNGRLFANDVVRSIVTSYVPKRRVAVLNADRASSFGAALHASVLAGLQEIPSLSDVLTQTIHVMSDEKTVELISSGTLLPTSARISVSSPDAPIVAQTRVPDLAGENCFSTLSWTNRTSTSGTDLQKVAISLDRHGIVSLCELTAGQ